MGTARRIKKSARSLKTHSGVRPRPALRGVVWTPPYNMTRLVAVWATSSCCEACCCLGDKLLLRSLLLSGRHALAARVTSIDDALYDKACCCLGDKLLLREQLALTRDMTRLVAVWATSSCCEACCCLGDKLLLRSLLLS